MMAWTSPLRTVRSMPFRISREGSATGTTCRSRITNSRSSAAAGAVSVTRASTGAGGRVDVSVICPLRRDRGECVIGMAWSWRREIGQRHRVERIDDRVAHLDPEQVHVAETRSPAKPGVAGILAGADHGGYWPFESANDGAHLDFARRRGQPVPAVCTARAQHEASLAQAHHQLFEVRPRQLFVVGHFG